MTITSNINRKSLIINLAIPLAVGGISALITNDAFKDYENVIKPPLAPPSWLFPIIWTILYILMGISTYLIYEKDKTLNKTSLIIYSIQLSLNFIWPIFFFGFRSYLFSFILLSAIIVLVSGMIVLFYKENKIAALIQLPYLVWLLFAGYLNLSVYLLN